LSFIVEPLNDIASHTQVERPLFVRGPLILDPELLSPLDVPVRALQRENRPDRDPARGVERKDLRLVARAGVVDLESGFHEMLVVEDPGMVESASSRICRSPLVSRLSAVDIVAID